MIKEGIDDEFDFCFFEPGASGECADVGRAKGLEPVKEVVAGALKVAGHFSGDFWGNFIFEEVDVGQARDARKHGGGVCDGGFEVAACSKFVFIVRGGIEADFIGDECGESNDGCEGGFGVDGCAPGVGVSKSFEERAFREGDMKIEFGEIGFWCIKFCEVDVSGGELVVCAVLRMGIDDLSASGVSELVEEVFARDAAELEQEERILVQALGNGQ